MLHVRSHVDVTDPSLTALRRAAWSCASGSATSSSCSSSPSRRRASVSFPGGEELLEEAARRGVDVIGAIPHYEDTREDGVRSLEIAVDVAQRHGLRVDVHCDEIDDEQSRFVEVLATLAHRTGLRERVTASHTTAMGSLQRRPTATSCSGSWPARASTWSPTRWSTCTCRAGSTATRSAAG